MIKALPAQHRAALRTLQEWLAQVCFRALAVFAVGAVISLGVISLERAAFAPGPPRAPGGITVPSS
ncbi:MAG: hypothetical protein KIT36_09850 [Alphaproteobacteria bacterium]|nr:hypothetical protein [Alphaproteobacteria bacterium]